MNLIAVLTSQAPPAAVQAGKPAGPPPQSEDTGPNFKEVLDQKKLEEEQIQVAAGAAAVLMAGMALVQDTSCQKAAASEDTDGIVTMIPVETQKADTVPSAGSIEGDTGVNSVQPGQKQGYFGNPAAVLPVQNESKVEQVEAQRTVIPQEIVEEANTVPANNIAVTGQGSTMPAEANQSAPYRAQPPAPATNRPMMEHDSRATEPLNAVDQETARILNIRSGVVVLDKDSSPFAGEVIPQIQYELDTSASLPVNQPGEPQAAGTHETTVSQYPVQVEPQTATQITAEKTLPATRDIEKKPMAAADIFAVEVKQAEDATVQITGQQTADDPSTVMASDQKPDQVKNVQTVSGEVIRASVPVDQPTARVNTRVEPNDVNRAENNLQMETQTSSAAPHPIYEGDVKVVEGQPAPSPAPIHPESEKNTGEESGKPTNPVQPPTEHSHNHAVQTRLNQEGGLGQNQDRSSNQGEINISKKSAVTVAQSEGPEQTNTPQPQITEAVFRVSTQPTGSVQNSDTALMPQIYTENLQKIVEQVGLTLRSGRKVAHIQLTPQDLGTIDIQLSSDANGFGVTILTEHASTGRLLESQMNTLRQSLQDAGLNLTHLHFGMKEQQSQSGQQFLQNNAAWSGKRWNQKTWQSAADVQLESPGAVSLSASLIDYKI